MSLVFLLRGIHHDEDKIVHFCTNAANLFIDCVALFFVCYTDTSSIDDYLLVIVL